MRFPGSENSTLSRSPEDEQPGEGSSVSVPDARAVEPCLPGSAPPQKCPPTPRPGYRNRWVAALLSRAPLGARCWWVPASFTSGRSRRAEAGRGAAAAAAAAGEAGRLGKWQHKTGAFPIW